MNVNDSAESLRNSLFAGLPAGAVEAVERLLTTGTAIYIVGGAVRDAVIGREVIDLDIVTDGDAIDLTAATWPRAALTTHERFRTASAEFSGFRIDVATARSETYAHSGALPDVMPSNIELDLRRRDFTVNAMALRISGEPVLLDPCHGLRDIDARLIRVIHDRSFEDDATRILRAHRYAARLGFEIEPHTAAQLAAGTTSLAGIGGERLRRELELLLSEAQSNAAMATLESAGVLRAIHPRLAWSANAGEGLHGERATIDDIRTLAGFALLASNATAAEADAIVERLRLTREQAKAVRGIAAMRGADAMLRRPDAKPSGVVVLLDRFPLSSVAAFAAATGDAVARDLAGRYLREWRHEKPLLRGDELQALGVPTGPQVQQALQLLRAARLDGWAHDRGDEQALAMRFAKSIRDSGAMHGSIDLDGLRRN